STTWWRRASPTQRGGRRSRCPGRRSDELSFAVQVTRAGAAASKRTAVRTRCQEEKQQSGDGEKKQQEKEKRTFLSLEEAGLVEMSGLSTHERFLCRLTISSLNLLRVISEQEGVAIEELNAGRVCDWFLKDKLKREQNLDTAVLQWDDPPPI
uniref:Receptor-interacting protein n=1 Tax=Aegilops tauschii subsp. strangulata TaxID=200361 RepID=A0A453DAV4_AEGTS